MLRKIAYTYAVALGAVLLVIEFATTGNDRLLERDDIVENDDR